MTRDLHAEAELRLGRPLTLGERALDLAAIDSALERGKEELRRAIEAEKARAARAFVRRGATPRLQVTPAMRAALVKLYRAGVRQARTETEAILGRAPARQLADDPPPVESAVAILRRHLLGISRRLETDAVDQGVGVGLGGAADAAIEKALIARVPGALDAASRLVSGAFASGLAEGFAPSLNDFAGWTYSAIMDEATCPTCEYYDGTSYDSWDAIQAALPDGGPNPDCDGNGRCRCRPVPEPA